MFSSAVIVRHQNNKRSQDTATLRSILTNNQKGQMVLSLQKAPSTETRTRPRRPSFYFEKTMQGSFLLKATAGCIQCLSLFDDESLRRHVKTDGILAKTLIKCMEKGPVAMRKKFIRYCPKRLPSHLLDGCVYRQTSFVLLQFPQ